MQTDNVLKHADLAQWWIIFAVIIVELIDPRSYRWIHRRQGHVRGYSTKDTHHSRSSYSVVGHFVKEWTVDDKEN